MYGKIIKRGYLYDNSKEIEMTYTDSRDAVVALAVGLVEGLLPMYMVGIPKRHMTGVHRDKEMNITIEYTGTMLGYKYSFNYEEMDNYDGSEVRNPLILQEIALRMALGMSADPLEINNVVKIKGGDMIILKPIYDYMEYDLYRDMSEYHNEVVMCKDAIKRSNHSTTLEGVDTNKVMLEMLNKIKGKHEPYVFVLDYTEQFLSEQISGSGLDGVLTDGEIESLKSVSKHIINRINTALDMLLA